METLIGILMILLPVALKLIGKRLEQAGKVQQPVATDEQEQTEAEPLTPEPLVPEPMVKELVEAPVAVKRVHQPKKVTKKAPILVEEEKKPKEKIDAKKLIVYSEIMKPKYTE